MLRSSTLPDIYDITPYLRYPYGTSEGPARERRHGTSQPSGMLGRAVQLYCDGYLNTTSPTIEDIANATERSDLIRAGYLTKSDMWDTNQIELATKLRRLVREGYINKLDVGNTGKLAAARARYAILTAAKETVITTLCDNASSTPDYWDLALIAGQRAARRAFEEHKPSLPDTPWVAVESDLLAKLESNKGALLRNDRVITAQAKRRAAIDTSPGTPPVPSGRVPRRPSAGRGL